MNNCMYFGVRTDERKESKECKKCEQTDLRKFKTCGVETSKLLATAIDVIDGKTVKFVGPLRSCVDGNLNYSNLPKSSSESPVASTRLKKVSGVGSLCKQYIQQGLTDEQIIQNLLPKYVAVGRDEKSARITILSTLLEMRKNELKSKIV